MIIKMILATDSENGIGYRNKLPWNFPEDLKFFKESTLGHSIVMGRKTYESIGKKPLPNRKNYVITKFKYDNVKTLSNIDELISKYKDSSNVLFVAGGKRLYEEFAPYAKEILLSKINGKYKTDVKIDESIFDDLECISISKISKNVKILIFRKSDYV